MEANELRVTNLVLNDGVVNAVLFIGYDSVQLITKQGSNIAARLDLIKPIPLTEEWLLKFGFMDIEEKLYCKRWRLDRVDIYKMISGDYPFYFRFNQVDLKIYSVHQLQTLYFALTEKELILK